MVIPDEYAQVNLLFDWTTTQLKAEVVFGISRATLAFTPEDVADNVETAYLDGDLRTVQTTFITLTSINVKFGPNDTGPSFELPVSHQGTLTNEGVTPNTALLIKKTTAVGGRRGRGRMYWPGIEEGVIDAYGNIDPGAQSTFQDKFTSFKESLSTNDVPMVVLHGQSGFTPHLVSSLIVQPVAATQRRRLRK